MGVHISPKWRKGLGGGFLSIGLNERRLQEFHQQQNTEANPNSAASAVLTVERSSSHIGVNFCKAARLEPPTFQTSRLLSFWAPPPLFTTCNAYYEADFCGVPNKKMTPNDIHDNHTTSFAGIQQ